MASESRYWANRRVSRRGLLRGAAVGSAGLAGAALIGCGGDDDDATPAATAATAAPTQGAAAPATAAPASEPKKGGTLTFSTGAEPRSLDPHFDVFIPMRYAYNILTRYSQDLSTIEPELAEALPEQPDELTYIYRLKQGVKFHNVEPANGREFVSEDVKYSIERQSTDEPGVYQHAYYFKDKLSAIETPDDRTVTFKTVEPYAPFQSYITFPWTLMINKEAVEKWGDLTENALGTGPFIFQQWQHDVDLTFKKNPDYFVPDQPYVDAYRLLFVDDPDTAATLYIDRKLDGVTANNPARVERIRNARGGDSNYLAVPSQFWRQFRMSPTTEENRYETNDYSRQFADIRVREAIVRGVDKKLGLDLVYSGDGLITYGPILPQFVNWALTEELAGYDPKKSKQLMEAAGVDSVSGPMIWASTSPESDQIGEFLKQQLAEINVDIELTPMELAAYYNQTYNYTYTFSHHVPLNSPDPDENLSSYFGRNSTYFKHYNPEIFDLVDAQAREVEFEKRREIVKEAQEKIVLDFPIKFLWTTNVHQFLDEKIKGWWYSLDRYENYLAPAWIDV